MAVYGIGDLPEMKGLAVSFKNQVGLVFYPFRPDLGPADKPGFAENAPANQLAQT